jgi:hypothetical protein
MSSQNIRLIQIAGRCLFAWPMKDKAFDFFNFQVYFLRL